MRILREIIIIIVQSQCLLNPCIVRPWAQSSLHLTQVCYLYLWVYYCFLCKFISVIYFFLIPPIAISLQYLFQKFHFCRWQNWGLGEITSSKSQSFWVHLTSLFPPQTSLYRSFHCVYGKTRSLKPVFCTQCFSVVLR